MKQCSIFLVALFCTCLYGEEISNFNEKPILLILPSSNQETKIQNKFTKIVVNAASNLKRFKIVDRSNVNKIIEEQKFQNAGLTDSSWVELGKMLSAKEALIVDVISFGQKGIPLDSDNEDDDSSSDEGFGVWLLKEVIKSELNKNNDEDEKYPNNIQTSFKGEIRKINLETGEILNSIQINAEHTGGVKSKSLNTTLDLIHHEVRSELKKMYLIELEVLELVDNKQLRLFGGNNLGVISKSLYSLYTRDSLKTVSRIGQIEQIEVTIPGREIGLISISESSKDMSNARILRKWGKIKKGYRVKELPASPLVFGFSINQGIEDESVSFCAHFYPSAFNKFNFDLNMNLGTVYTNRTVMGDFDREKNIFFGLGVGAGYNIINFNFLKLQPHLYLPLNWVSRYDDNKQPVSSIVVNPNIGLIASIMIKKNMDLVISLENSIFEKPDTNWSVSTYEENEDDDIDDLEVEWEDNKIPEINMKGLQFRIGLKFFSF